MLENLKQQAMKRGMKLLSNPKFMKMMADPRVMKTIGQLFSLRGRIQSEIDERLNSLAATFNLATRDEVKELRRTMHRMEGVVSDLESRQE